MQRLKTLNILLLIIFALIVSACGGKSSGNKNDITDKLVPAPKSSPLNPTTTAPNPNTGTGNIPTSTTNPPAGGGSASTPSSIPTGQTSFEPVSSATKPVTAAEPKLTIKAIKSFEFTWTDVADANHYKISEDADSASGYTPVTIKIPQGSQSATLYVPLHKRINARYILESCNQHGCTPSEQVDIENNLVDAIGYLKASRSQESNFGGAIDISANGKILAVSEPLFTTASGERVNGDGKIHIGAVNIYQYSTNAWQHKALLSPKNLSASDKFGSAISLSDDGKTLAIGVANEDSNASTVNGDETNSALSNSGAVYVYASTSSGWVQQAYIKPNNGIKGGLFGSSLSVSANGNQLAISANKSSASNTGSVYIFNRNNNKWQQSAIISGSTEQSNTLNVSAISLSADAKTLAIGDSSDSSYSGAVYIYAQQKGESSSAGQWQQQAYIKASNTDASDSFGISVSLSGNGNTLAVGAPGEDSNSQTVNANPNNNSATDSGAAYIFTRSGSKWQQQAYLKASNTTKDYTFGVQLNLSADGNSLIASSLNESSNALGLSSEASTSTAASESGAAYLFAQESGTWKQTSYIKASNTERGDRFSSRVGMSADANTLVITASGEDSNATGIGGDQKNNATFKTGAVYIY